MNIEKKPVIYNRQKTLLGLLDVFGGRLQRRDFQKYLFLFVSEFEREPSYEFVPYKYGCFSFQSYADKRRLIEIGALLDDEDWHLNRNFDCAKLYDNRLFSRFSYKYSHLTGDDLVRDVYRRYPYYAINSEIASRLMDSDEISNIKSSQIRSETPCFFTIGYEGSSFEGYLNRLIQNDVRVLVDVRKNPLSRKYGFSKKTLSETVEKLGIRYIHIPDLGISSDQRQRLNSQVDYNRLFSSYEENELKNNLDSLDRLRDIAIKYHRVAITCFEAEVCMCHRGRIAKALERSPNWELEVLHI